ncbi:MAG: hypothetical protein ACOC3T_03770 [Bacteroidota bacterium]
MEIKKWNIWLLAPLMLIAVSCVTEKRLAREFVENPPENRFVVMSPNTVFRESLKPVQDTLFKNPSQRQLDSLAFLESKFVQYITDSMFIDLYMPAFKEEMDSLGLNVIYNELPQIFSDTATSAYIFDIAQVQLQEFSEIYYDKEAIMDHLYYQKHILDGVHLNVWAEFQKVNMPGQNPMVLFSEITRRDEIDGFFHQNQLSGEVKYSYKINELEMDAVKNMITRAGYIHASYFFDFLMNQYISTMMMKNEAKPKYYLHYNREEDTFVPVYNNRFIRQE